MAAFVILMDYEEENIRKNRVFRDRTMQLDILSDSDLIARYRMPRLAILSLVELVRPALERATQRSHPLSPETQVLVTLRYLGKGGFLSEIGDLHGVSEASVSRSFDATIQALCANLDTIRFPWGRESQSRIKQGFYKLAAFPNVIGCIDGTQVPIKRPSEDQEVAYVNRKGFHSVNVQAVCDSDLRFLNVVAKWPGSTHDGLILQSRGLGRSLEQQKPDGWLLGDSGCLYKSTGCLWFTPEKSAAIIMAAFKLHNYCLDNHVPNPPTLLDQELETDIADERAAACKDGQTVRRKQISERFST